MAPDVDLSWLAKRTELFSGSDLKHLCVSAALDAVKEGITLPWFVPKSEDVDNGELSKDPKQETSVDTAQNAHAEETAEQMSAEQQPDQDDPSSDSGSAETPQGLDEPRVLYLRHFTKALKEISPSSSESLGSLSALRKWNE